MRQISILHCIVRTFLATLSIIGAFCIAAGTAMADEVEITPGSVAGNNIKRAADYLENDLEEPVAAGKLRKLLIDNKVRMDSIDDANALISFTGIITLDRKIVKAFVNRGTPCRPNRWPAMSS